MLFFYLMIAIMPLDQHQFWGRPLFGTFTIVKLVGLVCFLIALYQIGTSGGSSQPFRSRLAWFYVAFVMFQLSSYAVQLGEVPTFAYSNVFSILAFFITVLTLVDSKPRLYRSLLVTIGAIGFVSLYTIRQQQKYGTLSGFRPGGMLADANEYALVVGLWMPIAFLWVFSRRPKWERTVCFACLMSTLFGTTFASSRGGFLGLIAAFLFLVWHSRQRVRNFAIVSALIVPITVLSPSSPLRRFREPSYGDRLAQQARLSTWKAGLRMIQSHPLAGVGLNNFKPLVAQYQPPGEKVVSLAHNTYVEIGAELGVPALIVFLGIFVSAFVALDRIRRRPSTGSSAHLSTVALGLQAGLISYLVSATFVSAWWQKLVWLQVFLSICMIRFGREALVSRRRNDSTTHTLPVSPDTASASEAVPCT